MKVLVAVASKHGSTQEIAYFIAKTMIDRGVKAEVKNVDDIETFKSYDAVVLGSAVYGGKWLKPALDFIDREEDNLQKLPVWLFSSGPIGIIPSPEKAVNIDGQMSKTGAHEHRLFGGKIDKNQLNFAQRAILYTVGAKDGDFRDWAQIETWASAIARWLQVEKAKVMEVHHV